MTQTQGDPVAGGSSGRDPSYPTLHLLGSIVIVSVLLLVVWTLVRVGGSIDAEVYFSGTLGLLAAFFGNFMGALFGGWVADSKGPQIAWIASTALRLIITPAAAVSLYFSAPVRPKPLLLTALAAYLILLVADAAIMLRYGNRAKH